MNLYNYRLSGIENFDLIKLENGSTDNNETISNNILLDVVQSKRTNINVSSYALAMHEDQPAHIYGGENFIFMKSDGIAHRIRLDGVKQVQSDNYVT